MRVFSIRRGGPGGAVHGGGAESGGGRDWRPAKVVVNGGCLRPCSVVFLFSEAALEEPFTAAERG